MTGKKTSDAQLRASLKYDKLNKEARQYRNKKSACKSFILKVSTAEDLKEVQMWMNDRMQNGRQG